MFGKRVLGLPGDVVSHEGMDVFVNGEKIAGFTIFPFLRELVMLGLVGLSLKLTPSGVRASNNFNYAAIIEGFLVFALVFALVVGAGIPA